MAARRPDHTLRARDLGQGCGPGKPGLRNTIADVPGVTVGHATITVGDIRTGVTAIVPHAGDIFQDKLVAAAYVLNGFGKSTGLVQVNELGCIETPILLTNTFGVGTCANALIRRAVAANPAIGRTTSTVNPVVLECNDGYLNDIQAMAVTEAHAMQALEAASDRFDTGSIGAGTGMSCFGFKGGIGSSSRHVRIGRHMFHLGALVLANFGRAGDLRLRDGRVVAPPARPEPDSGSCIIILATDVPLDHRLLGRVSRRGFVGLARCGSFWGNGSGDIALAVTTANRFRHDADQDILTHGILAEGRIDRLFQAAADATQEAVYDALAAAGSMTGRSGHHRLGLADHLAADVG